MSAVRAGGVAYYQKPVDMEGLLSTLATLDDLKAVERGRVLLVDDDRFLAEHLAMVLQDADMDADVVTDPMQVLDSIQETSPDLLVLDLYMPGCTGWEVACVIRQQPEFVNLPIVFLSGESDIERQLAAMSFGGDEFLTKPVAPSHLIAVVKARIKRAGGMVANMSHDGLTGLLNHGAIKERLALEVEAAKRVSGRLIFANIDLDRLQEINTTFGHSAGDRVLKSLALLLKSRIPERDMVGRLGSHEFGIIMRDMDTATAIGVLDALRMDFAKIEHRHQGGGFYSTFSCGVAGLPKVSDPDEMIEAADRALRAAKGAGRNRVLLS